MLVFIFIAGSTGAVAITASQYSDVFLSKLTHERDVHVLNWPDSTISEVAGNRTLGLFAAEKWYRRYALGGYVLRPVAFFKAYAVNRVSGIGPILLNTSSGVSIPRGV